VSADVTAHVAAAGPIGPGSPTVEPPADACPAAFVRQDGPGPIAVVRDEIHIYDTDASGLIYYGTATRFFHDAQLVLFRHLGYRPDFVEGSSTVVRSASFELHSPLRMGDVYESEAWVAEVGRTSIRVGHRVVSGGRVCLTGTTGFVHVSIHTMQVAPLPAVLASAAPVTPPAGPRH
jgi:acyl-CoA thioesterase FadM